jgi:bifunctional oligoribonuclease and PAP phosphatase NrnA
LGDMGKEPFLYCALDMPDYIKYLPGWDRVSKELPTQFDLSIIVDTSSLTLLEKLEKSAQRSWVASRPCIVLDHHSDVPCDIPYATVVINDGSKVATGELIYSLAKHLNWPLSVPALESIASAILADSLGLTTENTTPDTYRTMAELLEAGVDRPKLEDLRCTLTKMPVTIFRYKATLIERTELHADGRLALITIPQDEITEFSPLFNPNALIQSEHLQIKDISISVSMKVYSNGRITGAIRCNTQAPIASQLASHFGGDGHAYAAGFKLEGKPIADTKAELIRYTAELLANINTAEQTP